MFENNRKTIGVFITQVHQEFQEVLSKGICKRAKELGYNVAFFANFLGYGEFEYEVGERSIALLPRYQDLDGIIILPDTMFVQDFDKCIRDRITKYASCPVVSVRQKIDDYYNVLIDDTSVLDEIIHHFIEDHGYRKINFLTGPRDNQVSHVRLEAFKRIMKEHNLPVEEDQTYFGDFWRFTGYDAISDWFSDPNKCPEAIICANDYMAMTVCNALEERGIYVPKDIAVSGCDNIAITEDFCPTITTAEIPVFEMGMEAVNKIYKHNNQIPQEKDSYMTSITSFRESCGCNPASKQENQTYRRNRVIRELEAKDKSIYNNSFMSVELTNVTTIEELDRKLASHTYMNESFASLYMCLHKNWEQFGLEDQNDAELTDDMVMELGIKDSKLLQRVEFKRSQLLPMFHVGEEPQVFFFNMLHYQKICYGYTAISFLEEQAYKSSYQGWLINVCNALENIRIHNVMNQLVNRLEDMSIKDELTGLYNRRALEQLGTKYMEQCIRRETNFMVFSADMDKLKIINDNFGHANGDIAIKTVADALLYASEDDELCIRISGDEFAVIGMDYDQPKMNEFIYRFESKLDQINQEGSKDYQVYVSFGWCIIKPNERTSIEDCLIACDSKMYQQKYQKSEIRL
jgi:diguanylate cyclase (GGDEF)-like protein